MRDDTLPLGHFEQIYSRAADPWHFADSPYEQAKYAASLAALPRPHYRAGFEVGCSIGVFTNMLAKRCDHLIASEPVAPALEAARQRCADQPWVQFRSDFVPRDWPSEQFDLIVLSEVLDYLGATDITALAERLRDSLAGGGDLLLVHWVGKKKGRAVTESSDLLVAACADFLSPLQQERNTDYRLDCLRRS